MFRSSLISLLLVTSAAASAEGFNYTFLQLDYKVIEIDDVNIDGDGFGLSGSFAINPDWFLFGAYEAAGLDFGIDATTIIAGIGHNTALSRVLDAYARVSYQYVDWEFPNGGSDDDNGLGLGVGVRFAAGERFELNAGLDYNYFSDDGGDLAISAGARFNFKRALSLGLGGSWSDDVSSYTLDGRINFGQ